MIMNHVVSMIKRIHTTFIFGVSSCEDNLADYSQDFWLRTA
jgi:hypothetical protein